MEELQQIYAAKHAQRVRIEQEMDDVPRSYMVWWQLGEDLYALARAIRIVEAYRKEKDPL